MDARSRRGGGEERWMIGAGAVSRNSGREEQEQWIYNGREEQKR